MKKLLTLVFLLVLLCGCAAEEEIPDRNNKKNSNSSRLTSTPEPTVAPEPTKTSPKWNITYVTATPRPTATSMPTPTMVPYAMAEEMLSAEEFSGKVQIADTVLQLPCKRNHGDFRHYGGAVALCFHQWL